MDAFPLLLFYIRDHSKYVWEDNHLQ